VCAFLFDISEPKEEDVHADVACIDAVLQIITILPKNELFGSRIIGMCLHLHCCPIEELLE
jgi:hypothetical protein